MSNITKKNKIAWEYMSYEFWCQYNGKPKEFAKNLVKNPQKSLWRHLNILGDVKVKKIANPLGSNGRKAVPLALLGADVTVIDFSSTNMKYAMELAKAAKVNIRYELSDFLLFDTDKKENSDFDIIYLEGGILHYFEDIKKFTNKLYKMLKPGGKIVLWDSHPVNKFIKTKDKKLIIEGDYFDNQIIESYVAYATAFEGLDENIFPKCKLRFYTMGEIITSICQSGFFMKELIEENRYDNKEVPGSFIIIASKLEV